MFNEQMFSQQHFPFPAGFRVPRGLVLGIILVVALFAFELFNFDTTRFALRYLLGDISFLGLGWATTLAIAFCAIDFAGLARLFTPEQGKEEPRAVWYLMGAWLLGATMNALMTWWAVSLTLLSHEFGNEVLSREQLLHVVPIFVAALVWLTRILFIGALSVAGEQLFQQEPAREPGQASRLQKQAQSGQNKSPHLKVTRGAQTVSSPALRREEPSSANRSQPEARRGGGMFPIPRAANHIPAGMQARGRHR